MKTTLTTNPSEEQRVIITLTKHPDGSVYASCPAFGECLADGLTEEEAIENCKHQMAVLAGEMMEYGVPWPVTVVETALPESVIELLLKKTNLKK